MIENINELAKFVKGGAEVLQKAIESEEKVSLDFVDGRLVTDSDLEAMKTSVREDAKKEGQTIGYDFAMKDIKKDFGIDVEGKDRKVIVETVKNTILADANKKPDAKIAELTTSLENLQNQYSTDKQVWEQTESTYQGKLKDISIMSELRRSTPEINGLKKEQFTTLIRSEYDFDIEDGKLIAKKNGQPVKNKMEQVIPVADVLTDYATQNGWLNPDGRGGTNQRGNSNAEFKTINDVHKHMETNNIDPMSPEGEKLLNEFKQS